MPGPAVHECGLGALPGAAGEHLVEPLAAAVGDDELGLLAIVLRLHVLVVLVAGVEVCKWACICTWRYLTRNLLLLRKKFSINLAHCTRVT